MDPDLESVSEAWRTHLLEPRCAGRLDGEGVTRAVAENPACGDVLVLYGARRDGKLVLRFEARGCWAVAACASACCEALEGAEGTRDADAEVTRVVDALGALPRTRRHAARMFVRALDEVLAGLGRAGESPRG